MKLDESERGEWKNWPETTLKKIVFLLILLIQKKFNAKN